MKPTSVILLMTSVILLTACCNGRKPVKQGETKLAKTVTIQASNGMFLCVDMNKADTLYANRPEAAIWETLQMETLDNGLTCFRSHHGKILCSDVGNVLVANRDAAGEWESFTVTDLGENLFSITNYMGQYVTYDTLTGRVTASKTECGDTEKFRIAEK
jgi:hypothetical protein